MDPSFTILDRAGLEIHPCWILVFCIFKMKMRTTRDLTISAGQVHFLMAESLEIYYNGEVLHEGPLC